MTILWGVIILEVKMEIIRTLTTYRQYVIKGNKSVYLYSKYVSYLYTIIGLFLYNTWLIVYLKLFATLQCSMLHDILIHIMILK